MPNRTNLGMGTEAVNRNAPCATIVATFRNNEAIMILELALILSSHLSDQAVHPRRVELPKEEMVPGGDAVTTDHTNFATARVVLRRDMNPRVDPYAEWMSLGPFGPGIPRPPIESHGFTLVQDDLHHRLRVVLGHCENEQLMAIEDILIDHADSRGLAARYWVDVDALPVWRALPGAKRVRGARFEQPQITWFEPRRFRWTTETDTLTFEQVADSVFMVTLRPRLR